MNIHPFSKTHVAFHLATFNISMLVNKVPADRVNIKMSSYQYRDSHHKDNTVWQLAYTFQWTFLYLEKNGLYIGTGPRTVVGKYLYLQVLNGQMYT